MEHVALTTLSGFPNEVSVHTAIMAAHLHARRAGVLQHAQYPNHQFMLLTFEPPCEYDARREVLGSCAVSVPT